MPTTEDLIEKRGRKFNDRVNLYSGYLKSLVQTDSDNWRGEEERAAGIVRTGEALARNDRSITYFMNDLKKGFKPSPELSEELKYSTAHIAYYEGLEKLASIEGGGLDLQDKTSVLRKLLLAEPTDNQIRHAISLRNVLLDFLVETRGFKGEPDVIEAIPFIRVSFELEALKAENAKRIAKSDQK